MGTASLAKFPAGSQDKGLSLFSPKISAEVNWNADTVNVTGGIRQGVGVRYGVAPLAGHSNTETPSGNETNGIQRSEITSGTVGLTHRKTISGIVPITMSAYDGAYPKINSQYYVYLVGLDDTTHVTLDACLGATLASSVNKQSSSLVAGLAQSSYRQESPLVRLHKTEMLNLPLTATPTAADMQTILRMVDGKYWTSYSQIAVSGKRIPYFWMLGDTKTTPDATTAPAINIWQNPVGAGPNNPTILCGSPSEIITRQFVDNNQRLILIYCLDSNGFPMDMSYTKQITQANTQAATAYNTTTQNYTSLTGATKAGASVAYASVDGALIQDPGSYVNSRHSAILVAGETPFAIVYQDWLQAVKGMMPRWVDLTSPGCTPRSGLSADAITNQPSAFTGRGALYEGGADTGILLEGVKYDIGFSYYNKLLDYETNVAYGGSTTPVGGADLTSLTVGDTTSLDRSIFQQLYTSSNNVLPWEWADVAADTGLEAGRGMHVNDYEIRFYYKEASNSVWLPAGSFDAALFWFGKNWNNADTVHFGPEICVGASGATVGGSPGGYNDYSPLPKQRYICTTVFQQRAFWWSEKSMHFSLVNSIYAYPQRNITAAPTGRWRGGIVHNRTSELNTQTSRLVVFGDVAYVGRFTGDVTKANVRISADTVGQFDLDGSDFRMDFLSEGTAFSFRSACVADGILYWWGPQGIWRDDGVSVPQKISGDLEQDIFSWVDMSRDSEVHCVYEKRTSEVVWFYPPKTADSTYPTYALAYNIKNGQFYPFKMRCKVDASQNIKIENDSTPSGVSGERVLLHCRETTAATVQRTFYFDELVRAGEQGPARELTVLTVATPTAGQRRLTFAAGSVGVTAGSIAVNDYLSIQNPKGYAPGLTLGNDFIAKIVAINNASSYVDIELPTDAELDATASLSGQTAFPVYQKKPTTAGLHGITYLLSTNYWLPGGLSESYNWAYFYFLFNYSGIPSPLDPFTGKSATAQISFSYRTITASTLFADPKPLQLVNNSDGNCQLHRMLGGNSSVGVVSATGQAIKYTLSGIHIGDPWTLEYLEAHCVPVSGFIQKEFEG